MYSGGVVTLLCPALSGGTCRKSECNCYVPGTRKHRLCGTTKAKLVRRTPETFKGLGLSQQTAFCPQKAMLARIHPHPYSPPGNPVPAKRYGRFSPDSGRHISAPQPRAESPARQNPRTAPGNGRTPGIGMWRFRNNCPLPLRSLYSRR